MSKLIALLPSALSAMGWTSGPTQAAWRVAWAAKACWTRKKWWCGDWKARRNFTSGVRIHPTLPRGPAGYPWKRRINFHHLPTFWWSAQTRKGNPSFFWPHCRQSPVRDHQGAALPHCADLRREGARNYHHLEKCTVGWNDRIGSSGDPEGGGV